MMKVSKVQVAEVENVCAGKRRREEDEECEAPSTEPSAEEAPEQEKVEEKKEETVKKAKVEAPPVIKALLIYFEHHRESKPANVAVAMCKRLSKGGEEEKFPESWEFLQFVKDWANVYIRPPMRILCGKDVEEIERLAKEEVAAIEKRCKEFSEERKIPYKEEEECAEIDFFEIVPHFRKRHFFEADEPVPYDWFFSIMKDENVRSFSVKNK